MRINNNNKIILLTLFLLFVIFVDLLFATEAQKAKAFKKIEAEAYVITKPIVVKRPSVPYSGDNLRDPFITALPQEFVTAVKSNEQVKLPELTIQGLILGPRFSQVIINNKVLKVGEQVSGASVSAISRDEVSVLFNGKYYILAAPATVTRNLQSQGGKK